MELGQVEVSVTIDCVTVTSTIQQELLVDLARLHGVDGIREVLSMVVDEAVIEYEEKVRK